MREVQVRPTPDHKGSSKEREGVGGGQVKERKREAARLTKGIERAFNPDRKGKLTEKGPSPPIAG